MKELKLVLVLRHIRVLPKLFMLLERLGADCLDVQGNLFPGAGGRVKLTLSCTPSLEHRVKTQLERLLDVSELLEAEHDEGLDAFLYQRESLRFADYAEGNSL